MLRRAVRTLDERTGSAPFLHKALRYVFPDHWSFLLGEVALYAFIVLVATGVYLTLYFEPSLGKTVYHGTYGPLRGMQMSEAYKSVVDISYDVKAGLLIRQTHHWAADVFVAAIVLHLLRIFFTGAFRKPRDLTYLIGLMMLGLSLPEGYAGYSMVDDLLSGMGLAIGYSVALSIPVVGANVGQLIWGAPYPGAHSFESRLYIAHVFIFPILIGTLLAVHLALVASRHHTQFRRRKADGQRRVIGVPAFPGQAPKSLGLMVGTAALLFLLGGLVQINPIWLWGPYETGLSTNGAQPDWYLGWLIGAMRLVPGFDVTIGRYTLVPNPLWGGLLFPTLVFAVIGLWPFAERRLTRDRRVHNVLDRPRDAPWRTALGAGFLTFVLLVFFAGSADRAYVSYNVDYSTQIWIYRALLITAPVAVTWLTRRICLGLQRSDEIDEEREAAEREARQAAQAPA
ncbi:MAG: cytochrome bc complex cytochrome b subunit [Actinobacteria bacterium]|nr:cytochrome bc complex cytochrome b subunit [Actinomycetota bacterium]